MRIGAKIGGEKRETEEKIKAMTQNKQWSSMKLHAYMTRVHVHCIIPVEIDVDKKRQGIE